MGYTLPTSPARNTSGENRVRAYRCISSR
jgi:hypothetical protein